MAIELGGAPRYGGRARGPRGRKTTKEDDDPFSFDVFSGFRLSSSVFVMLSELLWQVMFVANDWQTGQRLWPRFFHNVPD